MLDFLIRKWKREVMKMQRNDPCWCGSGKKYKKCHMPIEEKMMLHADRGEIVPKRELLKTPFQIEKIKESAALNTAVLDEVAKHIRIGMSTAEIDRIVYDFTTKHGGIPAPLHYEGFPKSVCTSINNEVCHGIPDENIILQEGDIVSLDAGLIYKGYHSDAARTHRVGKVSPEAEKLIAVTKQSFFEGIKKARAGNHLYDISNAIDAYVTSYGYGIVRALVGHGIGTKLHEEPQIPNFAQRRKGVRLQPGMTLAIEPMINMGSPDFYVDEENGWTVYTEDGMPSAQWEVTVAVMEDGYELMSW